MTKPTFNLVSGYGQFHTNEADPKAPGKKLTPYVSIDLERIHALVDNPPKLAKAAAQWLIPSTLPSRNFKRQESEGVYWMLWADLDKEPRPIAQVSDALELAILGDADFEIYSTRSATKAAPKSRILIPIDKPLSGDDWILCQRALNDQLEAAGFTPDRVNERTGQLCYLPNRGALYESRSRRNGVYFDPMTMWGGAIGGLIRGIVAKAAALEAAQEAAIERRKALTAARVASGAGEAPSLIAAFNECFTVQDILVQAGYAQRGDSFCHPASESGSYSASVKDGRVHSLSANDPLYTQGGGVGAHDAFSAFTILMHGGNEAAALKDAGDNWLKIGAESWNDVHQRLFAQAEAAAASKMAFEGIDPETKEPFTWPEIGDPFGEYVVPPFPLDTLPDALATFCREKSAQSGFDAGAYAFCLLVAASNLIDHRKRMFAGPLAAPPFLWGGLVSPSGGGKSPTMGAAMAHIRSLNDAMVTASNRALRDWIKTVEGMSKEERKDHPQPPWGQLIASDTTVEALGQLLQDNPSGILLAHDELTEFIGRLDAYSAAGGGKDRGVYLRSFDGGSVTINRASKYPLVIENFSVGILAGIQPEKLGELFKQRGGGTDGLYQRFLVYAMQPAGNVDYSATLGPFTEVNASMVLDKLHGWTQADELATVRVCPEVLPLMQEYHQNARNLAQRTAARRFSEHLDKFPGFLARVAFALHCIECAASDNSEFVKTVSLATFERARKVMRHMYHHSQAVYMVIDSQSGDVARAAKTACEAILAKHWDKVQRGDLTRYATDWRTLNDRHAESALDLLIELGWLKDVTPPTPKGLRGRRSSGVFLVNPQAHQKFAETAKRITHERNERYQAIQQIASDRNTSHCPRLPD